MKSRSNWGGRIAAFLLLAAMAAVSTFYRSIVFAIIGWLMVIGLALMALLVLVVPDRDDPNDVYDHWDETIDQILNTD